MRRGCKCGLRGCGLGSRAHTVCIPCVCKAAYTVSGAAGDDGGAPRGGHHPGGSARPTFDPGDMQTTSLPPASGDYTT